MIEGIKLTRVDLIAALCFALGVIIGIFRQLGFSFRSIVKFWNSAWR